MTVHFQQLNDGWNVEPNAPDPGIRIVGEDLLLSFFINPFQFKEFNKGEIGILRFSKCQRYRLGSTNDEGWYRGQCRFSGLAPSWGEFYCVWGDQALLMSPTDWEYLEHVSEKAMHFLFYFRDNTFECIASHCNIEASANNSLHRTGKTLRSFPSAEF